MTTIKSPRLIFKARESEPRFTNATNGTTHIVAITEKGPIDDTEVYNTIYRFKEVYGSEKVPNGSVSNIERAIEMGSAVRVFKVETNTTAGWQAAITRSREFDDAYQLFCSHLSQHLSTSAIAIHTFARNLVHTELKDRIYFIELETDTVPEITASEYVAYFLGKIGYYIGDNIVLSDCLGTVAGLADRVMDRFGVWKPFSGIVRGIVSDGQSIKTYYPNHLNLATDRRINIFDLKTNRNLDLYTKPTLLSNLTNAQGQTPFGYLYNMRLLLYLKKTLNILLESYLEEPNTFSTWVAIASEGQSILQSLYADGVIAGYTWAGDQNASSYEELQINSEEDVRNGIYKVQVSITEQALLQELTFELILDNQNGIIIIN